MINNYSLDTTVEEILHYEDAVQNSQKVKHIKCHIDDSSAPELYLIQLAESLIVYSPETECFIAKMSRDHKELAVIESAHRLAEDELLDTLVKEADRLGIDIEVDNFISGCF